MKILDELIERDERCSKDESNCPDLAGTYFSYVALMIYMVIANVLLINLLIAMFRYIQNSSNKINQLKSNH